VLYEVVQLAGEWCLRIRTSGQPIAWSLTNDAAFQSYCREQMKGET